MPQDGTTYTTMHGGPGPSRSLRGAMLSLELGTSTGLEHSLPFADPRHVYLLGVSHRFLELQSVLGVPTVPLVTEL